MSLPKILPISWSLAENQSHIPATNCPESRVEASYPDPVIHPLNNLNSSNNLNNLNHLNSSNNHDCSTCLAHEITNWLPPPSENPLSVSPCSPCLRGSSSNHLNNLNSSNNSDLSTLQTFYNSLTLPTTSIHLNPYTTIHDLPKFISTHLSILKRYPGNRVFLLYRHRLLVLKAILSQSP